MLRPRASRAIPAPRAPVPARRLLAGAVALAAAAAALLSACHENVGPGACFDSASQYYPYWLGNDTSLVFHWPAFYMPVRVYAEPTGELRTDVVNAMNVWEGAFRCREVTYSMVSDSTRADIIVRNPATAPLTVRSGIRAFHADSVLACTGVTQYALDSAGTAITGPVRSYVSPFPGYDSATVASCYHFVVAHELGHALGILAESPDTGDIMYPLPYHLYLSEADRYTIQLLYHTPATIAPPPRQ